MVNALKALALSSALAAALAPSVALGAIVESCDPLEIDVGDQQLCFGENASWTAQATSFRSLSLDVFEMDESALTVVQTQGFNSLGNEIGGCIVFRQSAGHDQSDEQCNQEMDFFETVEL